MACDRSKGNGLTAQHLATTRKTMETLGSGNTWDVSHLQRQKDRRVETAISVCTTGRYAVSSYGWKNVEAAGPEIPGGDREARLLRSRHAGGVPSVEAAGPEPLRQQIPNLVLAHDFAA
jgi:hypothetical protein